MGALTVAFSDTSSAEPPPPAPPGPVTTSESTLGETSTEAVPTETSTTLLEPTVEVELPEGYGPP